MASPTVKQLQAFCSAATCANFATAAQRLHLSVSSLSKRIAELEQALGCSVFDRRGHRAVLTTEGVRLLPAAQQVLESMVSLQRACAVDQGLSGPCSFGVGELSALTWLPQFVAQVRRVYPNLTIQPCVEVGAALERRLAKGELDFAVIAGRSSLRELVSQPVGLAQFAWMASPDVLVPGQALSADLFQRLPLITQPFGAGTTRLLDDWLLASGFLVQQRIECNNWVAIAGMLRAGLGLGFLPVGWSAHGAAQGPLQVLDCQPALAPLHYAFQWRRDDARALIPAMRALLSTCVDFSVIPGLTARSGDVGEFAPA